ncbi:KilA-N domain-containing protein [Laspinema olomoucense]|uniref:KilA-N domain-containing protein n=1 Tax=Laspinema olomoucense TaxID=3231600 RepID=UPI0021BA912C|nr:KilA-N domain-containing protein [Laspinema sp. D3d]MCT7971176.1 KilA-N domain-containing protein [Laspinema sp. D3d]
MSNLIKSWNGKIIRIRGNRYVSLTDMAIACGKSLSHWTENKSTHSYLAALSTKTGIPAMAQNQDFQALVEITKGGNDLAQTGTWGHPKVAIRFAQWCSDEFAVQVDCWIDELLTTGVVAFGPQNTPLAPFWYQRLLLDGTKNKAPAGYFTIFREVIDLVRDLEANGYVLPDNAYPDISVGLCWATYLKNQGINPNLIRRPYQHHYPDGRIVTASAYENKYLPEFREWFNRMYLTKKLPKYLGNKDKSSLPALEKLLELTPGTINRLLKMSA